MKKQRKWNVSRSYWERRQGSTPGEEAAKEGMWQACSGTTTEASKEEKTVKIK